MPDIEPDTTTSSATPYLLKHIRDGFILPNLGITDLQAMKSFYLLMIIIVCMSCRGGGKYDKPYTLHRLWLSFQDASGNDLLQGIDSMEGYINPDEYTLKVIWEDPCWLATGAHSSRLGIWKYESRYIMSVTVDTGFYEGCDALNRKLVFQFTCPYVFGDNEVHNIVTFWKRKRSNRPTSDNPCYRIEFDGKVITGITHKDYNQLSLATIVLDR